VQSNYIMSVKQSHHESMIQGGDRGPGLIDHNKMLDTHAKKYTLLDQHWRK